MLLLALPAFAADVLWYSGNSGVASAVTDLDAALAAAGSTGITRASSFPSSFDAYDLVIFAESETAFNPSALGVIQDFIDRGGTLVLLGDVSSVYNEDAFNQLAHDLRLQTRFVDAELDPGCDKTLDILDATHPLAAGMTTGPIMGAAGDLSVGTRGHAVFAGPSGETVVATEGTVVFVTDLQLLADACTWTSANEQFVANLYAGICSVGGDLDGDGSVGPACGGDDCDDDAPRVRPTAPETCDGLDDDCDGVIPTDEEDGDQDGSIACEDCDDADPTLSVAPTWYPDADGDGEGVLASPVVACEQPAGYAAIATDCDDADASTGLLADELCDGVDNDCDGRIDEADAVDASTWHADADGDGYGDSAGIRACTAPDDTMADGQDCDDTDATRHPAADETCDGLDQDCDGVVDEDAVDGRTWYADADGDGYGDPDRSVVACDDAGASGGDDCDDADPDAWPGATGWSTDCEPVATKDPDGKKPSASCSTGPIAPLGLGLVAALLTRRRR